MKHLIILLSILGVAALFIFNGKDKTISGYVSLQNYEPLKDYGSLDQAGLNGFKLIDNSGNQFSNTDLTGKVWLIHTFFTHCPGVCPALIGDIKRVLQSISPDLEPHILSVTVDPDRDSPSQLNEYLHKHGLDANSRWHMVTGEKQELTKFADLAIRIGFPDTPESHSPRVVLLDKKLHVRGFYNVSETDDFERLLRDMLTLGTESKG